MRKSVIAIMLVAVIIAAYSIYALDNPLADLFGLGDNASANMTNETNETGVISSLNESNVTNETGVATSVNVTNETNGTAVVTGNQTVEITEQVVVINNNNILNNVNIVNLIQQLNLNRLVNVVNVLQTSGNVTVEQPEQANISLNITVKEGFPQGKDYVFMCNAEGFTPTMYSWFFGDGGQLINISNGNVFHRYAISGDNTVLCIATDGERTAVATGFIRIPEGQPVQQNVTAQEVQQQTGFTVVQQVVVQQDAENVDQTTVSVPLEAQTVTVQATNLTCADIAGRLSGVAIQNGDVCDVVVVRQNPQVMASNVSNLSLNRFTLMNSVFEFHPVTTSGVMSNASVHVMGDFALTEAELNPVLRTIVPYNWTLSGVHTHMIQESPKMSFVHWMAEGNVEDMMNNINTALAKTTIKG